ncbi:MAG: ATP-binding protein, partial [Lachnospiraceae bacterium]|nr:ATP-binding protein [Lachnospiraceae bacterium]
QKIRYKDSFDVRFDVDSDVNSCCVVKLILQPLLENAINYGVSGMDDGEITVMGRMENGDVILTVRDNGIGIPEEEAVLLLADNKRVHKHGSGVGLVNINKRIQLLFGKKYGLRIESEPDEGTSVSVCIPAIPFTEENRRLLEKGPVFDREETISKISRENSDEE